MLHTEVNLKHLVPSSRSMAKISEVFICKAFEEPELHSGSRTGRLVLFRPGLPSHDRDRRGTLQGRMVENEECSWPLEARGCI
jgi:hypothetical protein